MTILDNFFMRSEVFPYQDLLNDSLSGLGQFKKDQCKIKVILPAYNEALSIGPVISNVQKILTKLNLPFEIIVIDDGSNDGTGEIVKNLFVNYKRNRKNRGKGFSILKGLHFVDDDDFVIMMDSDGEHYPEDIPLLLKSALLNQADMVIGSRFCEIKGEMNGGSYLNNQKRYSQLRKFGNWLFSTTIWVLTRKKINDTQSGFRVFRPGVAKRLAIQSHGFTIETEITTQVLMSGGRVKEVAIHNGKPFRGSYIHIMKDGFKIILTACKEGFPKILRPYFDKILKYQK